MRMKKAAVLFPGIGYTCDRPLLYYAGKLAQEAGYQVIRVPYGHFQEGVKGNEEKMRQSALSALEQARALLKAVDFRAFDRIVFIGKSVGTVVAGRYALEMGLKTKNVLFTPVLATFEYAPPDAIVFHGTADPWAETNGIVATCRENGIPCYLTEGANHSLETGHVETDLSTLVKTMELVKAYIE